MSRSVTFGLPVIILVSLAGCAPDYSPNTYSATAVQQANKVEPAIVVGFRQVAINANGTVGAVTGGAAGGILGAQTGTVGLNSALGAVGGTAIGSLLGTSIEHVTGDTRGWEYIVRKPDGEMLSVTQREDTPIPIGQKVLVITGNQARIVPDYSVVPGPPQALAPAGNKTKADDKAEAKQTPAAAPAQRLAPTPDDAAPPSSPAAMPSSLEPVFKDANASAAVSEPAEGTVSDPAPAIPLPTDSDRDAAVSETPST